jgi:hypothetical protein
MTGGRVLPLVLGLWAIAAFGQVTASTVTASQSILMSDSGTSLATAYWVTGGSSGDGGAYAMANAGYVIQVYDLDGGEHPELEPTPNGYFVSFAVYEPVIIGASTTTTLVVASEYGTGLCTTSVCLDIFFWDPIRGFQLQAPASPIVTPVFNATAMAIDGTVSPINVYYSSAAPQYLYEQAINVNSSTGMVTVGALNSRSVPTGIVYGMTVDAVDGLIFLSDGTNLGTLYSFPLDVTNGDGGYYATTDGGFSQLQGISFVDGGKIAAGGVSSGVYILNADAGAGSLVLQQFIVKALDAGTTFPAAASLSPSGTFMLVTEDINGGIGPWLHIVTTTPTVDAGPPADSGVSIDAGGNPGVPIIAPGPGALPPSANSCNCSSAGSAPVLLTLLLPLLLPRRRR